jgi:uncharacterized membrane protein HdeD (DUF308 family)
MAKLTMAFGGLLILIGIGGFVLTGSTYPTALIPSVIGAIILVSGILAQTEDAKRRMLWMHIAVAVGLLGALATIKSTWDVTQLARGVVYPHPIAVEEKGLTFLVCAIFVAFCVRSFIAVRRSRLA